MLGKARQSTFMKSNAIFLALTIDYYWNMINEFVWIFHNGSKDLKLHWNYLGKTRYLNLNMRRQNKIDDYYQT